MAPSTVGALRAEAPCRRPLESSGRWFLQAGAGQGLLPCRRRTCWQPGPGLRASGKEKGSPGRWGRMAGRFCGTATAEGCWRRGDVEALAQAEGQRSVSAQLFYIYFLWYIFALFIGPPRPNVRTDKTQPVRLEAPGCLRWALPGCRPRWGRPRWRGACWHGAWSPGQACVWGLPEEHPDGHWQFTGVLKW